MHLAGIAVSTVICGLCSQITGYWYVPVFIAFVPWLLVLDRTGTLGGAVASALAFSFGFVAAIFAWFGFAIAVYSSGAALAGLAVLLVCSPLLQPQFLVFAIVRHVLGKRHGFALRTLGAASAWVAAEWMFPKLLADSAAHGLYQSDVLRQMADFAGTPGMTFLIVVANECFAATLSRALLLRKTGTTREPASGKAQARQAARRHATSPGPSPFSVVAPAAVAIAIIAAMAGYGAMRLQQLAAEKPGERKVRVGLVQSNISAYDRLRREMGTYEAVRYVLDTHFAMSREAIEKDRVDALVWSETVFPTTFGKPKSDTGAQLDREIADFVTRAGVPLVFGSYDRDAEGEYNSAVFLEPRSTAARPRFGVYRKTRLFLLTEYVPSWMDGAATRAALPWAGNWKPGPGARVLPLRTAGGNEVAVLPMICLDDVDTSLALEGARLGAAMILTLSNDSWFTEHVGGAHLHLVVAAFRSIETRLPQLRVTNNGISAVIDETGEVLQRGEIGERRVVVAEVAPRVPRPTPLVRLGEWVGPAGFAVTALLLAAGLVPKRRMNTR